MLPVCMWQVAAKIIFLVHHFDFHALQLLSPSGLYQRVTFLLNFPSTSGAIAVPS